MLKKEAEWLPALLLLFLLKKMITFFGKTENSF